MNVTGEMLKDMGVVSMSLSNGASEYVCFLRKIRGNALSFSLMPTVELSGDAFHLKIVTDKNTAHSVPIEITEFGVDWCDALLGEIEDEVAETLFSTFKALEMQDEKYGRRKEVRISIGKENCKRFGLESLEQKVFVRSKKIIQPCAIVDASIHGVCIITPFSDGFKDVENFCVKVGFSSPVESAIMEAHKVHSRLVKTERSVFAKVSAQLLEPISHIWKGRVARLIEELNGYSATD
ncbi:MAG: hypothetical protein HDR55_04885 [Treponema sp.]|nr:hypothetical protein [Treponema sp.]